VFSANALHELTAKTDSQTLQIAELYHWSLFLACICIHCVPKK